MANSAAADGLKVQKWDDEFFREYFQENPFRSYMGTDANSIIQVKEDQVGRYQKVTYALLNNLSNNGVTGSNTLEGSEESMDNRSFSVTVDKLRNAIRVPEIEEQYNSFSLRQAARPLLMDWAMETGTTQRVVDALQSINGVAYGSASEAQKDAWLDDNTDRVFFGVNGVANFSTSAPAGGATYDHSASLALCDTSADILTTSLLSTLKRAALTASPKIKPIRVGRDNRRYYVAFVHPRVMADLKTDTALVNAQRETIIRQQNNRLFQGGDVEYDGIIVHEVDQMPILSGVGAASADVSPVFFCGAQAVAYAIAKRWRSVSEQFDYEDKQGVAVETIDAIEKMQFGAGSADTDDLKDHGLVTGYVAVNTA
jgi:N4-gp56 family major capsid protein